MKEGLKEELIDYGRSQLSNYEPKNLHLDSAQRIDLLLDAYSAKWLALEELLKNKKQEILMRQDVGNRPEVHEELDKAICYMRTLYTTTYRLIF